jgi:hypothetical protein
MSTADTTDRQERAFFFLLEVKWLHQTTTVSAPITWIDIYVFAPETFGTMVSKTVSVDQSSTMFTGKIFDTSLKTLV